LTDAIIWADKLPDIIRKWILIVPMILAICGSGTGIYQYFDKTVIADNAKADKDKAVREVAIGFQSIMVAPKTTSNSCGKCMDEINKLKRWH